MTKSGCIIIPQSDPTNTSQPPFLTRIDLGPRNSCDPLGAVNIIGLMGTLSLATRFFALVAGQRLKLGHGFEEEIDRCRTFHDNILDQMEKDRDQAMSKMGKNHIIPSFAVLVRPISEIQKFDRQSIHQMCSDFGQCLGSLIQFQSVLWPHLRSGSNGGVVGGPRFYQCTNLPS